MSSFAAAGTWCCCSIRSAAGRTHRGTRFLHTARSDPATWPSAWPRPICRIGPSGFKRTASASNGFTPGRRGAVASISATQPATAWSWQRRRFGELPSSSDLLLRNPSSPYRARRGQAPPAFPCMPKFQALRFFTLRASMLLLVAFGPFGRLAQQPSPGWAGS